MTSSNKLLLVSTPRHLYLSIGMALSDSQHKYHLVFIDQKLAEEDNVLYQAILKNMGPFVSVGYMPTRGRDSKISHRKAVSGLLRKVVLEHQPVEVISGNDRRFEYQYALRFARRLNYGPVRGGFIDDGTGSYISSKDVNGVKYYTDKLIDTPLKKLVYGSWYERASPLGKSSWVDIRYLCHPEFDSGLDVVPLISSDFLCAEMVRYLGSLLVLMGEDNLELQSPSSLVIVLPHTSVIKGMYGSLDNLVTIIEGYASISNAVFIKYHPREAGDPLELADRYKLLNSTLPMEMYLSLISFTNVIGDVSSALMACKWLRPECTVSTFENKSSYSESVERLFRKLGIKKLEVNNE